MEKLIIIEDGNMFYGTPEQFADCFFSNNDDESIMGWCEDEGMSCYITEDPSEIDFLNALTDAELVSEMAQRRINDASAPF